MLHDSDKSQAAVTAASFSLMLLHAYYSAQGENNPVITALKAGLTENRNNMEADELIEELAGGNPTLSGSPKDLAQRARDACIRLAELFANALVTGAEHEEMNTIRKAIEDRQSHGISSTFAAMRAPTLSSLFTPSHHIAPPSVN